MRKFHRVEGRLAVNPLREAPQSTRLLRHMLAVATKLEQGVAHGTFTRQGELAVVLATGALAGGMVVAACMRGSSVGKCVYVFVLRRAPGARRGRIVAC